MMLDQIEVVPGAVFDTIERIATAVAAMLPGTRFTEKDGLGRTHDLMVVFRGYVIFDNGLMNPVVYGEVDHDTSIEVTHIPTDASGPCASPKSVQVTLEHPYDILSEAA